ncbi:diaminopimelate decarboxylase [Rhodospirillum rubrum]|uniref:Diaminopimelate decarboxylase n=1 Tax=Rhodospirillum rubrum (strain ATCC 11170 / ATH 1.1.1 / DSM 467 / LMG 4362 / NCIMB 8255 / S1) TaxID=269796 RepID=Q2RXE4_RHORT|nr:diaminopimelate decarboxylase [Rhodospirillum rubrum]ABC21201.1 diaminopimelate decarboxylase [Rhodospirillum rubrum ATCC 11170]AEO46875.1 diaminopimelate decarboxylase [Rhodospirillum rubrum F11]MBK5952749.1 diaminopimelate decarboxylase [Rhodospirillum rubrum]QXG80892.1 diaminopimelate decarboxylase [Rhodospirillum rubrum]
MDYFSYRNGQLHAEDVALAAIAEAVGTPFYVYSAATLERHFRVFSDAFAGQPITLCFATKTNGNKAVLALLAGLGAGADVVSQGEMEHALAAGVPAGRIVFSGVAKTKAEMAAALEAGIFQINVESEPELEALSEVAQALGKTAPVALRINPDVAAATHDKIATGRKENKFGIDWTVAPAIFAKAAGLPGIAVKGVAVHIGSQILDLDPFRRAFERLRELVLALRADGIALERVDLGGGLGIPYHRDDPASPPPAEYAALARRIFGDLGVHLVAEPGRLIAGNAGMLVSRVVYRKQGETRTFLILDAGFNDLIRPAMYDAFHDILPVTAAAENAVLTPVDVVGPICESGDIFARQRPLPPIAAGDLVAFATAGAYGASMSSTYNGRPLVPEVMVSGDRFAVVRRRPSVAEMTALESVPPWLAKQA